MILKFSGSPATVRIDAPAHSRRPASSVKSRPASSALASAVSEQLGATRLRRLCERQLVAGLSPDDRAVANAFHRIDEREDGNGGIGTGSYGLDDRREQRGRRERACGVVHDDHVGAGIHRIHPCRDRSLTGRAAGDDRHRPRDAPERVADRVLVPRRGDDHDASDRCGRNGSLDRESHERAATDREERLGSLPQPRARSRRDDDRDGPCCFHARKHGRRSEARCDGRADREAVTRRLRRARRTPCGRSSSGSRS